MTVVEVNASRSYSVEIGRGLLGRIGEKTAALGGAAKVCVISDRNVWPLYGEQVEENLLSAGFDTCHLVFPAGESFKNGAVYLGILDFLAQNKLTRSDLIVALGGGVVGDLAGFAAATYLRGIRFIQVPTTLLAAVDSSVGGKTAIDLPSGKNLAGAFWQPSLVLCDIDTLDTLPEDIFRDGCAEVIKTAVLFDPELYRVLCRDGLGFDREKVIARCVELKRDVVNADEFDRGLRQKLNLGHTIGHSVEALSGFAISHGKAVAIGSAIVARASAKLGICDKGVSAQIQWLFGHFGLPLFTGFAPEELAEIALSDKKRDGGTVNLIVPKALGDCVVLPTPVEALTDFIKAGL